MLDYYFISIELFKLINKFGLKLNIGSGSELEPTGSGPGSGSRIYEKLKPINRSTDPVRTGTVRICRPNISERKRRSRRFFYQNGKNVHYYSQNNLIETVSVLILYCNNNYKLHICVGKKLQKGRY